jgi:hypothetical protein
MLTYRTGAAGAPSAARLMGEHLLQQTLSPEMAAMAEYYEQGVRPPSAADAVASRYGRLAFSGGLTGDDALDETIKAEADRLADNALGQDGRPLDWDVLVLRALAAFVAANLIGRDEALASAQRLKAELHAERLDGEVERARTARDYSSATATPRRDMHPALAKRLGIDPCRGLRPGEVAYLLNGQRTDGSEIEGRTHQTASLPIAQVFGLDPFRRPTRVELENVLDGRKGNGEALPEKEAKRAVRRLRLAMGAKSKAITEGEREHLLSGRAADGRELTAREYRTALETSKSRIGYIDLTFSAPKSVSIAWAFAPTSAERAIIHQAHRDAIDSTMLAIEKEIGRASKGRSARFGYEQGVIGWVSFDHYAARPTVEIVRIDDLGQPFTELHRLTGTKGRVPGDMQVHTHVAVPNIVETPSGRVGSLDLAQLEGRIHEWGALYQAHLASNLRTHGVEVELDRRTELAKLSAVPDEVAAQFSRRTLNGTDAARAYAASQGLDWDALDPDRKVGLLKSGVQNRREGKADDISDMESWQRTAASVDYEHKSVLKPNEPIQMPERAQRLERAYQAAAPLLAKQFERRAVLDGADARIAAAKGLIVAGVDTAADVGAITRAFRERGIQRRGAVTALVWGTVQGSQGRDRIAITTTLDIAEERRLIRIARAGGRDRSSALTAKQIKAAIAAFPEIDFTSRHGRAQHRIVGKIGMGGRISAAIGVAGSGKSTLLKPLVRAWQDDGRTVYGVALAWRQSDDLAEAGIPASNTRAVASFLHAVGNGRLPLGSRSVVVIDEIGLLGTRQLNEILTVQKETGFQLVMLGDPLQMQAVEAGPVIALLRRALGKNKIPELASSVRQKDAEEREAVLMFRNGQAEEAIKRKDANGTLKIVPGGYKEAVEYVATLWAERRQANHDRAGFSISVSAPTNAEAHDVSLAIRTHRRHAGEVGPDRITVQATDGEEARAYDLALAEGDRVRLFRRVNAKFTETDTVGNIGRNGTVLEVVSIEEEGLTLRNQAGKEGLVAWRSLTDERNGRMLLAYGDALTTNTAQGTTVTEHIHAIPAGTRLVSAFGAYTSGSRHREQSFIVTSEGAERAEIVARRPLGDRREVMRGDVLNNIVRNFSKQPVKESALDLLDRAANLRRGTIRTVQASLHGTEARAARQEEPITLGRRFAANRTNRILETQIPGLVEQLQRHTMTLAQIARSGNAFAERMAELALRHRARKRSDAEYWRDTQSAREAPSQANDVRETRHQKHGQSRGR